MDTDGGSFDAAPPPVGSLGNFKGVMLCNRPSEEHSRRQSDEPPPFKSMIAAAYGEQTGLTPFRNFEPMVKKRGPSAALRRHMKWLKELQSQMSEERKAVEEEEVAMVARDERLKATVGKHREAVREMFKERETAMRAEEAELNRKKTEERLAKKGPTAKGAATAPKPLWAMTAQEKDTYEEGEADALIDFAEQLDYDKLVNDLDFRHGLEAMKDRAGKLKKEQDAFKDALLAEFNRRVAAEDEENSTSAGGSPRQFEEGLEGQSLFGDVKSEYSALSRRSKGQERYGGADDGVKDWDSSTACGEERKKADPVLKSQAEAVLESNTQMRAVHSKASVQKAIEKAREKAPMDLQQLMRQEGATPCPVITMSADMQDRLHKPVDPSNLPYLYRSPAI